MPSSSRHARAAAPSASSALASGDAAGGSARRWGRSHGSSASRIPAAPRPGVPRRAASRGLSPAAGRGEVRSRGVRGLGSWRAARDRSPRRRRVAGRPATPAESRASPRTRRTTRDAAARVVSRRESAPRARARTPTARAVRRSQGNRARRRPARLTAAMGISPWAAVESPHWRTSVLPVGGHRFSPLICPVGPLRPVVLSMRRLGWRPGVEECGGSYGDS